jgi:hypothetical protein
MQEKLRKKISKSILFAAIIFVFLISSITAFIISQNYVNSFADSANQSVKLATSYSQIKLDNIRNDSLRLSQNETIIAGLNQEKYSITINPKLNFLRSQYQEEISSIIIYASNNYIYKTDSISVSNVLSLDNLLVNEQLLNLDDSSLITHFFIQHNNQIISHFSFLHEIYAEDLFLGYMLINIRPTYLLSNYFSYQNTSSIDVLNQYLLVNNQKLYFQQTEDEITVDKSGFIGIEAYVIADNLYEDSLPLITKVSTDNLISHIIKLTIVLIVIDVACVIFAYVIGLSLAKKISSRFKQLQTHMLQAPGKIK